ncbi:MAG TPA: hypothetical protein VIK32_12335, partial [Candidatus Limnocylindrales bacterium]
HANTDQGSDSNPNSDPDSNADSQAHTDANAEADRHRQPVRHAGAKPVAGSDINPITDCIAISRSDTVAVADPFPGALVDGHANSDADAVPVAVTKPDAGGRSRNRWWTASELFPGVRADREPAFL